MPLVFFTQSAKTDLLEIWLYIADQDVVAADQLLDRIEAEANILVRQPTMGRARFDLTSGLRSWPVSKSYNLFYVVSTEGITVIRVLHHARDTPNVVFKSDAEPAEGI
jgi:toxin ParE1/3/4